MKNLFNSIVVLLILLLIFLLISSGVYAQFIADYCSVDNLKIKNEVENGNLNVEITYKFICKNSTSQGQMTKFLISLPYTDIRNLKAEDQFGSMKVLEGPKYVAFTKENNEAVIGVIFRKALLINENENTYWIKIIFDTLDPITIEGTERETTYTLKPSGFAQDPRITIITQGITQTSLPLSQIDYTLELPSDAILEEIKPAFCTYSQNVVTCESLTTSGFTQVEVKWKTKEKFPVLGKKVREYTKKYLPSFLSVVGNLLRNFKEFLNSTGIIG